MKKFVSPLTFFVFAFFLFSFNVKADTTVYTTLNEDLFSHLSTNRFTLTKQYADNYLLNNSTYKGYVIAYYSNYDAIWFLDSYTSANITQISTGPSYYRFVITFDCSSNYYVRINDTGSVTYSTNNGGNLLHFLPFANNSPYLIDYTRLLYYYSQNNIPILNMYSINTSIDITSTNYHKVIEYGGTFPTLYDIKYEIDNPAPPPTPSDNYPLLTSFYSIFINKLTLLCNYITANYIILSIFVILIFYYTILIFRRLK